MKNMASNPAFDVLYCEEERFEDDFEGENGDCNNTLDLFWENDELIRLLSKEQETHLGQNRLSSDKSLVKARKMAVDWILSVNSHYGFNAVTAILAVNYLDRFISSLRFQRDKPWMSQLVAVACLSLAAKVEETQVPLLLDLQVEESKYVFEARTIQRMELLILSTLQWKMNPVTPFSFIDHIIRRIGILKINLQWEFQFQCEHLLLSAITNSRIANYLPSVIAAATILLVIKEVDPFNAFEYQNHVLDVLKISKEKVDKCSELMLEIVEIQAKKRKYESTPGSPDGVIDAYFSCDSSNDSWAVSSSSPEPPFKKMAVGVLSNSY